MLDDNGIALLARRVLAACDACEAGDGQPGRRWLGGIAGAPGSGKSTAASRLFEAVESLRPGVAAVCPMDGFHMAQDVLRQQGLLARKGAPWTFDVDGFVANLAAARDLATTMRWPAYDRQLHEPRFSELPRHRLHAATRLVIVEGNYLLLDELNWRDAAAMLDEAWWMDTPADVAAAWIVSRHMAGGRTREAAMERYHVNDADNTRRLANRARTPDVQLRWPAAVLAGRL